LKEALQDLGVERVIERVAKPEGDTPRDQGKRFFGSRASGSGNAERRRSKSEAVFQKRDAGT